MQEDIRTDDTEYLFSCKFLSAQFRSIFQFFINLSEKNHPSEKTNLPVDAEMCILWNIVGLSGELW